MKISLKTAICEIAEVIAPVIICTKVIRLIVVTKNNHKLIFRLKTTIILEIKIPINSRRITTAITIVKSTCVIGAIRIIRFKIGRIAKLIRKRV